MEKEIKSRLQPDMKNLLLLCLVFTGSCIAQDTAVNSATHDHASAAEWFEKNTVTVNKAAGNFSGLVYDYTLTSAPGTDNRLIDFTVDSTSVFRVNEDGQLTLVNGVMTGQSLTGSEATSLLDLATTWNTTGTPTALKLNVTDTDSNASSLLMDLQVGGVSKLALLKSGNLGIGTASPAAKLDVAGDSYNKNGVTATEHRIFNTYTDASNGEWLQMGWKATANVAVIQSKANGTGTVRPIQIFPGTADAADNQYTSIYGGGTGSVSRGAAFTVYGNEGAIPGSAQINLGVGGQFKILHNPWTTNAAFTMDTAGNVGIGTATPTSGSKLDVAGGITLRDKSAMTATAAQSKIWSESGEMKVIDAAGNVTTISPHPQELMDVLGVTGAAKTLGMDYTTPESGLAVAQPKARWLEWYVEIDHATGAWTKRNFNGNEIESGQSNDLIK
jgi:hypothetical protein